MLNVFLSVTCLTFCIYFALHLYINDIKLTENEQLQFLNFITIFRLKTAGNYI